jgi:cbb3-type cytochrome oxidase subunit 3
VKPANVPTSSGARSEGEGQSQTAMTITQIIFLVALFIALVAGFWFAFRAVRKHPSNNEESKIVDG